MKVCERRRHFIGDRNEEAPFYWLFERGGTILLGKFVNRLVGYFYFFPKPCRRLAGVLFYGPSSTWRAGHCDQVILLVWPNCFVHKTFSKANSNYLLLQNFCSTILSHNQICCHNMLHPFFCYPV